jgi:pimeloyl-ACP methyl ester carboxylesterase
MLRGLKRNVLKINERGVIYLKVVSPPGSAPTYAFASPAANTSAVNAIVGFQHVGSDGVVGFLLLQSHRYNIGAFTDLNGNGAYDPGEPVALLKDIHPTPLADTAVRSTPLELSLSPTNRLLSGQLVTLPKENGDLGEVLPVNVGEIANLDEPKFSAEAGEQGMWRPFEFLQENGIGIYFLEPYNPHKLPVLFIYGISGSFQDWRPILKKLDRRKYQPWLFQYPSGLRLAKSANALAHMILLLRAQHSFERMAIVAHSMGGLVSRGAIQLAVGQAGTNFISELVTISTPWAGHEAAELGVKYLDYPVPSWHDMNPGSAYLQQILAQPLPLGTQHDLIFGFKSAGGFGLPDDNDGVVGVASELVPEVEDHALRVYGLHLDHNEILRSPLVLQKVEQALAR